MGKKLAELLSDKALKTDTESSSKNKALKGEAENEENLMKPYDPKTHSEYLELKRFEIEQANPLNVFQYLSLGGHQKFVAHSNKEQGIQVPLHHPIQNET
jgi:hypothetical protein